MKKRRVMVLVHEDLVPPDSIEDLSDKQIAEWKAEFDVISTLKEMGHDVLTVGVLSDLGPIREAITNFGPDIVFILLEEFHGVGLYDHYVVGYLELLRVPYTGCNPRGLLLTHDKALSKKVLTYHRVLTPRFTVVPMGRVVRRPKRLELPLLVKSVSEDASLGIAQASVVYDDEALKQRVQFIHEKVQSDAIVEQYIEGRELYVGLIGNARVQAFPVWEMKFDKMPEGIARIATRRVKWDPKYQERHGIRTGAAEGLPPALTDKIYRLCKRAYRALYMSGYARMDLRLTEDGRVYLIEANANPNLEYGEDFAESAESVGVGFEALLQRIINLGLQYQAAWRIWAP